MSGKFKKQVSEREPVPARVAIPQVDPGEPATPEQKRLEPNITSVAKKAQTEPTAKLFVEIPQSLASWMGHYKVDSGHNKNEIASEALSLLKSKVEGG